MFTDYINQKNHAFSLCVKYFTSHAGCYEPRLAACRIRKSKKGLKN